MRTRRRHYWALLRSTFWFIPSLMIAAAILLAGIALAVDVSLARVALPGWIYAGGADGARALLSTVAGSVITIAGLGFSITIVALVLASTQFGPRLLTLFMRDATSQATLGTFAGTFTFCVLILRSIRGVGEGQPFVPQFAVTVAIGLTLLSVAFLVYFFHHVAVSIQAPNVAAKVARDLDQPSITSTRSVAAAEGPSRTPVRSRGPRPMEWSWRAPAATSRWSMTRRSSSSPWRTTCASG